MSRVRSSGEAQCHSRIHVLRRSRSQREPGRRLTPGLPFESPPREQLQPGGMLVQHQPQHMQATVRCSEYVLLLPSVAQARAERPLVLAGNL